MSDDIGGLRADSAYRDWTPILTRQNEKRLPEGSLFSEFKPGLAVGDIHGYFKAKTHFGVLGLGPHDVCPLNKPLRGVFPSDSVILRLRPLQQQRKTRKSHS